MSIAVAQPQPLNKHEPAPGAAWRGRSLLGLLLVGWLVTGVFVVPADQQAVVTRFGRIENPRVLPGIHMSLPWPLDRVTRLKVRQLQRLVIGGDVTDSVLGRSQPAVSQFLTGDQNIIHIRAVVQYSVAVPADYLFRAQDVSKLIGCVVESELARRAARRDVDSVLTTEKTEIQDEVRSSAQKRLNQYGTGVLVASVNLERISPPAEAADAFRDVASARADAARIYNEALGYANDILPKARGEARQSTEAAEAYKQTKVNQAQGEAARFEMLAREYAKAGEVTSKRLYLETMEEILPKIKKLILDHPGN